MRVFLFILLFLVLATNVKAEGPVQIWAYAFVTYGVDEPIAGYGASIFKPSDGSYEGPLESQEHVNYRLKFAIKERSVTASLSSTKGPHSEVSLEGPLTQTPDPKGKGCLLQARLTNGIHYVLLERLIADKCAP